jgi:ribosomal protein S26
MIRAYQEGSHEIDKEHAWIRETCFSIFYIIAFAKKLKECGVYEEFPVMKTYLKLCSDN